MQFSTFRRPAILGAVLLSWATIVGPAQAQMADREVPQSREQVTLSYAPVVHQAAPAVVNISTRQRVEVQSSNPFAGTPFEGMFGDRGGGQPTTREGQSLGAPQHAPVCRDPRYVRCNLLEAFFVSGGTKLAAINKN